MPFFDIYSKRKTKEIPKPLIKIDFREKNSLVPSFLPPLNINFEFVSLPVADYIINDIAIERKTISDLKSSIIDKRIFSQLTELSQFPRPLLLIEGDLSLVDNSLRGVILSISLNKKFPIIFSQNEKDTAIYLSLLAKKQKHSQFSLRPSKIPLSPKEQIQYILEGFPHIGPSKSLIEKFHSLKNIFNASEEELSPVLGKHSLEFKSLLSRYL